jgi:uncharacterized protein YvpB
MVQWGMNINPRHPVGQPNNAADLAGVKWVRVVFKVAAAQTTLDNAFTFYDSIVSRYTAVGTKVLFVLNQETFWGHGPWDHGDWDRYAREFAAECGKIVARYKGKGVAWEIWNEGDLRGGASVFVPPEEFAKVLKEASAAIRKADSKAPIILGGLAGQDPIKYVTSLRSALGGSLPVDAIGIHPYGQVPPNMRSEWLQKQQGQDTLWGGWFGLLADSLFALTSCNAMKGYPLWITEIGVSEHVPIPPERYPMVTKYMRGIQAILSEPRYTNRVPVVVWFGWSDVLRNAGIVDNNNNPKPDLYKAFFDVVKKANTDAETPRTRDPRMSQPFKVVYRKELRVRTEPRVDPKTFSNRTLLFGEVVYADPSSRTVNGDYVWWEHEFGWSAAERVDGSEYLMLPLDAEGNVIEPQTRPAPEPAPSPAAPEPAPVETPVPTTFDFRVIFDGLRVRSSPRTGDDNILKSRLKLGDKIEVNAESITANGFIWWQHERGWSASRSVDGNQVFMEKLDSDKKIKSNVLEVPWISQISSTAPAGADCGQTCVLMLLRYYNKADANLHVKDLTDVLTGRTTGDKLIWLADRFGLAIGHQDIRQNRTSLDKLTKLIDAGKPAIVLVYYRDLQLSNSVANPPKPDPLNHWFIVRGYEDDIFYINDPLWVEEEHRSKYPNGMIPIRTDTLLRAYRGATLA